METDKPKSGKFKLKPVHLIAIIVVIVAVIGVAYIILGNAAAAQTVVAGDNVSVYYTGTFTNGTVFSTNFGQQPLNFTAGSTQLIQGFSYGVIGMRINETENITIPENEAYGAVNPSLIITVPRTYFGNESLTIGSAVSSSSGQQGVIKAFNTTNVIVDFNPPLAGQTLKFKIKLLAIEK